MVESLNREDCERVARDLLTKYNVSRWPVRVDRIAKQSGIKVHYSPLDDELSGMAFYKENVPVIAINARHHVRRQRFTIAHELGHFNLHDDILRQGMHVDKVITMLNRNADASLGNIAIEIQANQFAAELLMPEFLVRQSLDQEGFSYGRIPDEEAIEATAKAFNVSATAMTYRIAKLF